MKCLWTLQLLNLFILFKTSSADQHTFGGLEGGDKLFNKKVIDDTNTVPKNYTIIFKYFGKKLPMLSQVIIDVSANSTGKLEVTNELQNIEATIFVHNALNVTATITIYSYGVAFLPILKQWPYEKDDYATKSVTIIYKKNATVSDVPRSFSRNAIGSRQSGDGLIYFESRNITNISRFPSKAFEYSGDDFITCVGFSFNSPTAMAMVNTTFISDSEFSMVVYDMNVEHFVANMSIYGFKKGYKPNDYFNLIGDGK